MINIKYVLFVIGFSLSLSAQKIPKLKPSKCISVEIPEPSDICFNSATGTFYIVSDRGILFESDADGKILRKMVQKNTDFEGVYSDGKLVFAVDETHRNVYTYDAESFKLLSIINVPYNGARNKGYEAITYNQSKGRFLLFTEKEAINLFELDASFKITNQIDLTGIARDISAATWHDGFLWLLSDESMRLMKLDPNSYQLISQWYLPVINPEGLTFDKDGNILVTCDDMQKIYYFPNPEKL